MVRVHDAVIMCVVVCELQAGRYIPVAARRLCTRIAACRDSKATSVFSGFVQSAKALLSSPVFEIRTLTETTDHANVVVLAAVS